MHVAGTAVERRTGTAVAGILVEAWDPGARPPGGTPLAAAYTDTSGSFRFDLESGGTDGGDPSMASPEAEATPSRARAIAPGPTDGEDMEVVDVVFRSWVDRSLVGILETRLVARTYYDRWGGTTSGTATVTLYLDDPFGKHYRLFGRAMDDSSVLITGGALKAIDVSGSHADQEVLISPTGRFELRYPTVPRPPALEFWLRRGTEALAGRQTFGWPEESLEADVVFTPAPPCRVEGRAVERGTGAAAAGIAVELLDGDGRWSNPVATGAQTDATGGFQLTFEGFRSDPPRPVLRAYRSGELVGVAEPAAAWKDCVLQGATVEVEPASQRPTVYRLLGQALDRATRRGVPDLRVEAWDADFTAMMRTVPTGTGGRFELSLPARAPGEPPQFRTRFYRDTQLIAQPPALPVTWSPVGEGTVFVEIDVPPRLPTLFRISGRVVDIHARTGIFGLRVEAWDRSPRDGGVVGVATDTALDGAFALNFPRPSPSAVVPAAAPGPQALPQPEPTPPDLFFRLYAADRLLATLSADVKWTPEGVGVTVIEIPAPAPVTSNEVGLHELGESIASTVDRVQTEFARYPTTMGAYVLDEIDLEIPVEMRVDDIGQVRTKVVDANVVSEAVGRVRMRVKPVLGATHLAADVPDQPLAVFEELTGPALAKLAAERIYSVQDLVRAARTGAGRAALAALDLGVDLDLLLGKAMLLALPVLPRAVREALLQLGVTSPEAFASHADPAALAADLTESLGQTISQADVEAWQARVQRFLAVPLPTQQTDQGDTSSPPA